MDTQSYVLFLAARLRCFGREFICGLPFNTTMYISKNRRLRQVLRTARQTSLSIPHSSSRTSGNCVQIEHSLDASGFSNITGNHIGVWPCNPDEEVDQRADVLGWQTCRHDDFEAKSITEPQSLKSRIASPSTILLF
jgi:sulfite reductase alpha subunit-like flavoprotein